MPPPRLEERGFVGELGGRNEPLMLGRDRLTALGRQHGWFPGNDSSTHVNHQCGWYAVCVRPVSSAEKLRVLPDKVQSVRIHTKKTRNFSVAKFR